MFHLSSLSFSLASPSIVPRPNGNPIIVNYLSNAAQTPNCTNLKKIGEEARAAHIHKMLKNL